MTISYTRRLIARLAMMMTHTEIDLDPVVGLIANEMQADACCAYALRGGEILELRAAFGLKQEAVGHTRLRIGEGIIGLTAATCEVQNLADAQNHPNYVYRSETGEDAYTAMLAVPIKRFGRLLGVLAVQNKTQRHYVEDDVEALQTIALLLGEMFASAASHQGGIDDSNFMQTLPKQYDCASLSPGIAIGPVIFTGVAKLPERVLSEDPEVELMRFSLALREMRRNLDQLIAGSKRLGQDSHDILAATRAVAEDDGWLRRVNHAIGDGLCAEAALHHVLGDMRDKMRRIADPYLRERLADFEDLGGRLMAVLNPSIAEPLDASGAIILTRRLGPAQLLSWHARGVVGVLIEEGSAGGHAAILGRALGIPILGGARGAVEIAQMGDSAIVDADQGVLVLRPEGALRAAYEHALEARILRAENLGSLRDAPNQTADGAAFELHINAGLLTEMAQLERTGAAGVGLFRTEIAMMASGVIEDAANQAAFYARVIDAARGLPVVFRTLDLGSDKLLPESTKAVEENPAMGWRSLRVGLDRPAVLRQQLRALLLAAGGRPLNVMFPMVANIAEFRKARGLLLAEIARVRPRPSEIRVGTMLEVPALLFQLDLLVKEADFISVGTNDLLQFVFAADRGTAELADRYDLLSPPMLEVLERIGRAAHGARATLSVCGEAASRPLDAMVLRALGFRTLSMSAASLLAVKSALMRTDLAALRGFLDRLRLNAAAEESLRDPIAAWAQDHGIDISAA